ncbi:MAG: hypothetical protein ACOCX1_04085, partial [Fimbriimonadaceae bacterium]
MNPESHNRILRNLGEAHADNVKRLARRAKVQIEFARAFAEQQKGLDVKLVEKAEKIVENVASVEELESAVRKVEDVLAPIGKAAKEYTIHCVGHGHIDMNWIWSWQETVAVTHDTFASVLSLMDEYPDFTYSQSQASVYELTEKYHPEMFKEIQKRVKEGRWEITAAHWVEGDKNLSSGESIARHLLYTRRYINEKFGLGAEDLPVDWEPDTFGHANTIPGILAQGGLKYYYSCRPGGGHEHARVGEKRPPVFWWEAPDGSRVLVNRETTWYNSYVNIGDNVALSMVNFIKEVPVKQWLNVFGIGNHGGGPTREELDWLNELATYPIYPVLKPSTVKRYFELLEDELPKDLPVFDHELNYEFTGCYTSQSTIKRANRHGENLCTEAETLAVVSGMEVPKENLRRAWINVLFNQFHDILPGSGITQTREHASGLFQETAAITGAVRKEAMKRFAYSVDSFSLLPNTPEGNEAKENARNAPFEKGAGIHSAPDGYSPGHGNNSRFRPFVVYNPCAWEREEFVTADLYDMNLDPSRVVARDEEGVNHPVIDLGRGFDWGHTKRTVAFAAKVPPLGYRTYLICEGEVTADAPKVKHEANDVFKTPFFQTQVDRFNGGLRYVAKDGPDEEYDLSTGVWQYLTESPVGMTSWILGGMPESYQSLETREFHVHGAPRNQGTNLPLSESIGYVTENQMVVPGTESRVTLRTFIHGLAPRIDFEAEVDWREIGTPERGIPGLQISFDWPSFSLGEGPLLFETPFGSVER